ncbi:hypothetical protein AKJ65_08095 [candidate division MSBL1 archaeon SCGC-AAA259E19]|uniref:Uncharacterized protein n=1 Tax=candidate division MSBL1 archaeon SCGC-AAA259E19 TaxID=1698264 RepID=A0A133UD17_9EURY|nr:hypothetical protein AKJ65_08095 [candidate division MSBL1 archaeon SCGC-AAA259E19]
MTERKEVEKDAEEVAERLSGGLNPKREVLEPTEELPVLRISNGGAERLNFDELLSENLDYPDFAGNVGNDLIKEGIYDDSDPSSFTFVVYTTNRQDALRRQMKRRVKSTPLLPFPSKKFPKEVISYAG